MDVEKYKKLPLTADEDRLEPIQHRWHPQHYKRDTRGNIEYNHV